MTHKARSEPDRLITAEEYELIPEENAYRSELVRGVIVREPLPGPAHGVVNSYLIQLLWNWAAEHDTGIVLRCGYKLASDPDTVLGPDVSFVSKQRKPPYAERGWWEIAPDLAVEVLSPSNRRAEMNDKINDYFTAGVRLVWLVDPRERRVSVYRSKTDSRVLEGDAELADEEVLPGFSVSVRSIFAVL